MIVVLFLGLLNENVEEQNSDDNDNDNDNTWNDNNSDYSYSGNNTSNHGKKRKIGNRSNSTSNKKYKRGGSR